jgi:hypothetical protein
MLECEGYKMFRGRIVFEQQDIGRQFDVVGTWLYKPETDRWYVGSCKLFPFGSSFSNDIVKEIVEYE